MVHVLAKAQARATIGLGDARTTAYTHLCGALVFEHSSLLVLRPVEKSNSLRRFAKASVVGGVFIVKRFGRRDQTI